MLFLDLICIYALLKHTKHGGLSIHMKIEKKSKHLSCAMAELAIKFMQMTAFYGVWLYGLVKHRQQQWRLDSSLQLNQSDK